MCWATRKKPIKKIAKEDVKVYKHFQEVHDDYALSSIMLFKYKRGKIYKIGCPFFRHLQITEEKHIDYRELSHEYHEYIASIINKGFHSYQSQNDNFNLVPCIIPKGAEYYVNENGEVVSNKILIPKNINYDKM